MVVILDEKLRQEILEDIELDKWMEAQDIINELKYGGDDDI